MRRRLQQYCGEAAVGAGVDGAEMRERAVQQNGSQRMSDAL